MMAWRAYVGLAFPLSQSLKLAIATALTLLLPVVAPCAISTTGDVSPVYPGVGLDPWNVGMELRVGSFFDASITIDAGSDVISSGGSAGYDPVVLGEVVVSGIGSTWSNTGDLFLGIFGAGTLDVIQGARVENDSASLGHLDGSGNVLVEGGASEWIIADELIVGNGGEAMLTIRDEGRVISGAARIGLNTGATGTVVVGGPGSVWEIFQSLSLGDAVDSGGAMLSLTGAGSRVYVGTAAARNSDQYPADETAVVISELGGVAQLAIYAGNQLNNAGHGYVAVGINEAGAVILDGDGTSWNNAGDVSIGTGGTGILSLVEGGSVSSGGLLTIAQHGTLQGNGTVIATTINQGTVAPGDSVGNLSLTGDYTHSELATLRIELAGTGVGQFDTLNVSGTASLTGGLEVTLSTNGGTQYVPQLGDTFDFLLASQGLNGSFSAAALPQLESGKMWQIRYASNAVSLAVTIAGDYNDDGRVDAADYVLWRRIQGAILDPRADGDTNGVVNAADYAVWHANFASSTGVGASLASPGNISTIVPEPESMRLMLVVGITGAMGKIRRRLRGNPCFGCWYEPKTLF